MVNIRNVDMAASPEPTSRLDCIDTIRSRINNFSGAHCTLIIEKFILCFVNLDVWINHRLNPKCLESVRTRRTMICRSVSLFSLVSPPGAP